MEMTIPIVPFLFHQVAANQRGIALVSNLIDVYGLEVVQAYMSHIQKNAEVAVRNMLKEIAHTSGKSDLYAEDFMDDGTPIRLHIEIDAEQGTAKFDFNETGLEVYGNCNAPTAVTLSAIIYCLRCMVGHDVPLNQVLICSLASVESDLKTFFQGCLTPISINIPKGSILSPSQVAAVVGGNVLTSQRVVDVIFKAFQVCAASQGCMNNITFGDESVGYYETIAGGAGAGPGWHGRGI